MYSQIDDAGKNNPGRKGGKEVYANKGSSARLVHYMWANEEKREGNMFFNNESDAIHYEDVKSLIDNNVKGLRKEDVKFWSLNINPSEKELLHIGNDKEKLKEFTKQCVANIVQELNEGKDKKFELNDLVWTAIIHDTRKYTTYDKNIPECKRVGESKENSMHVHIILSNNVKAQNRKLSIKKRSNFNIISWAQKNQSSFCEKHNYILPFDVFKESQIKTITAKALSIKDRTGIEFDIAELLKKADAKKWNGDIAMNIKNLDWDYKRGYVIANPSLYVENGKAFYDKEFVSEQNKIDYSKGRDENDFSNFSLSAISGFELFNVDIEQQQQDAEQIRNYKKKKRKKQSQ